jgi:hypothetical protein
MRFTVLDEKVAAGDSNPAPRAPPTRKCITGIEPALGGLRRGETGSAANRILPAQARVGRLTPKLTCGRSHNGERSELPIYAAGRPGPDNQNRMLRVIFESDAVSE